MDRDALTIRSYRLCFRLERRIYKIDRFRVPVSWGVPLRSVGYAAAILCAVLLAQRLPGIGDLLTGIHPAVRYAILPIGAAYALTELELDGRPAHQTMLAWLRWRSGPRQIAGLRAAPGARAGARLADISIAPDERGSHYRPARVAGPCRLLLRYPGRVTPRRGGLVLEQTSDKPMRRGKVLALDDGQELRLR